MSGLPCGRDHVCIHNYDVGSLHSAEETRFATALR
jgi:hypothetical protein